MDEEIVALQRSSFGMVIPSSTLSIYCFYFLLFLFRREEIDDVS